MPGKGDEELDFVLMKTFAARNAGNGRAGLCHVLTKGLNEQKQSLVAHQKIHLKGHLVALTMAVQTLANILAWFTWFLHGVGGKSNNFADKVGAVRGLHKVAEDQLLKELRSGGWQRYTRRGRTTSPSP